MAVAVRGRLPSEPAKAFQEIQERLIALERDSRNEVQSGFTNPGVPGFGPGLPAVVGGGGSVPPPPAVVVSDHGTLIGLLDDDHPQYVEHGDAVKPHQHTSFDVSGLEDRFVQHFERVSQPHTHAREEIVGLDPPRPQTPMPHSHTVADLADFRTDAEFVLMMRIYGG